jgi:hypothetical protein
MLEQSAQKYQQILPLAQQIDSMRIGRDSI